MGGGLLPGLHSSENDDYITIVAIETKLKVGQRSDELSYVKLGQRSRFAHQLGQNLIKK